MGTMTLRRMRWLALVLPGLAMAGRSYLAWLPGLAVAVLGLGLKGRLRKELEALFLPTLALFALPALVAGEPTALGAFALAASLLASASLGVELESGLWAAWLTQPLSRRRLLAEKLAVVAALLAAGLAQFGLTSGELGRGAVVVALAIGVAPYLTLTARHALFGGAASVGLAFTGLLELQAHPGWLAALTALVSVAGLWGCFYELNRGGAELQEDRVLRWLPTRSWAGSALGVMVRKELRLQSTTLLVAGLSALGCLLVTLRESFSALEAALFFCALVTGAMAGIVAVSSEHRFGTLHGDVCAVPVRLIWRVKAGVALGVAALAGVVLPHLLSAGCAAIRRALGEVGVPSAALFDARGIAAWSACVLLLALVGLVVASAVRDLSRALLGTLGAAAALGALVAGAVWSGCLLAWSVLSVPGYADLQSARWAAAWVPDLHVSDALAEALVLGLACGAGLVVVGALWRVARQSWLAGSLRPWRPLGAVALAGTVAGFGSVLVLVLNVVTNVGTHAR